MFVGIVGLGHWGKNYIKILSKNENITHIYCFDLKKNKDYLSKKVIFVNKIGDLTKSEIKTIFISTPADTHFSLLKYFMKFNKKIFVEKPVCLKKSHITYLRNAYKKYKELIMVDHTFVYHPAVNKIKNFLNKNKNKFYYIESTRKHFGLFRDDVNAIWDLIPHDISICNYLFNEKPKKIECIASTFITSKIDSAIIKLNYSKKRFAIINLSWANISKERKLSINLSGKKFIFDDTAINKLSYITYKYTNHKFFKFNQLNEYLEKNIKISEQMPLDIILNTFLKSNKRTKVLSDLNFGLDICDDILNIRTK